MSRIQTLKNELNNIQKPLQTEINKIPFMGLYAALIESDINTSQESLITTAKQKIAQSAIEKVKTEMSSHTIVQDNQIILDIITSKSSGEMQIYDKLDDKRTFTIDKTQLIYIAVINVYPLKSHINTDFRKHPDSDSYYVVDLISEGIPDWFIYKMTDLLGSEITKQKVNVLSEVIKSWKTIVDVTNTESIQTQNDILRKVQQLMQVKKDEITSAESNLYQARQTLETIYKSLAINCYQQPEDCLDGALVQMDKKIKTVVDEYIRESQKEKAQDGKIVPVSSDPASDMKPVVMNLYRTVKEEYCKKEQVMRTSVLNKGYMIEDNKQTGFYITKQPETIYIYPYIKNRNMHVLLVMGFKIIKDGKNYQNSFYETTDILNFKTHISKKYYLRSKAQTLSYNNLKKILYNWYPKKYIDNDYKDNNDGTVTDYSSGLMWQKEGSDHYMTFKQAERYIAYLNITEFGGYYDWRLPTLDELISLIEKKSRLMGYI